MPRQSLRELEVDDDVANDTRCVEFCVDAYGEERPEGGHGGIFTGCVMADE